MQLLIRLTAAPGCVHTWKAHVICHLHQRAGRLMTCEARSCEGYFRTPLCPSKLPGSPCWRFRPAPPAKPARPARQGRRTGTNVFQNAVNTECLQPRAFQPRCKRVPFRLPTRRPLAACAAAAARAGSMSKASVAGLFSTTTCSLLARSRDGACFPEGVGPLSSHCFWPCQ